MSEADPAAPARRPDRRLFDVLRVGAAMCFVGHGAFGLITKAAWLPYFAVVGIGPRLGYALMPVIGTVDIVLGLSMLLWPTKAALAYMTTWAVWTALLRPLAGQGVAEFLERAGNYGVPFALLLLSALTSPDGGWFERMEPRRLDPATARRVSWVLRVTTATLLLGHGVLAAAGKPQLAKHLAAIGVGDGGPTTRALVTGQGGFEIGLALAVLVAPASSLALVAVTWKVATELLFPLTGDYVWEFVERGGSYVAPLGLMLLCEGLSRRGATHPT